jgi:hypothetical protein
VTGGDVGGSATSAREDALFVVDDREPDGEAEARFWEQGESGTGRSDAPSPWIHSTLSSPGFSSRARAGISADASIAHTSLARAAAFQVSNDPSIHRATQSWSQRLRAALRRGPRGRADPRWLGSAVDMDALTATAERASLKIKEVEGVGTQFCLVLARRHGS